MFWFENSSNMRVTVKKYKWKLPENSIHKDGLVTKGIFLLSPVDMRLIIEARYWVHNINIRSCFKSYTLLNCMALFVKHWQHSNKCLYAYKELFTHICVDVSYDTLKLNLRN